MVGGPSSVASQDKPAKVAKPVFLHEVLKSFVGKDCYVHHYKTGTLKVSFEKRFAKQRAFKFDMLGVDFIRLSSKLAKSYIPFSAIKEINTD